MNKEQKQENIGVTRVEFQIQNISDKVVIFPPIERW